MAQIHNEIRKGWLSEAVNRALGRTREGGVERVSETCDVVMNPWGMPEWAYYRGELLLARRYFQAAVPGEFAMLGLLNPTGSNVITVVEALTTDATTAQVEIVSEALALVTTAVTATGWLRDRRSSPVFSAGAGGVMGRTIGLNGSDVAASISTQNLERLVANVPAVVCVPVILNPGTALVVTHATVNTSVSISAAWRERKAQPGELV